MYRIICITDNVTYLIHQPDDATGQLVVTDPILTLETGKSGELTFTVPPTHPHKDKIRALVSEVLVYQDDDTEPLFAGRPIGTEEDFYNIGSVTCEGELSYLCDSVQRPYEFSGNATGYLEEILSVHNGQVEEKKRFTVGKINVPDTSANADRSSDTCETTMDILKSKLTEVSGGNLVVRRDGNTKYLDYVSIYGDENTQAVRFGVNIADITRTKDPTELFTCLVPYGAEDDEGNRITITEVNGGTDYLVDQAAVQKYGYIWATETFDDAEDPSQLLAKAQTYLSESTAIEETIEITAIDMHMLDSEIKELKLGCYTTLVSEPHDISQKMLLTKKVLHLDSPEQDTFTFGKTVKTFTGSTSDSQFEMSLKVDSISGSLKKDIDRKVDNATQLITGGLGGYLYTHLTEDGHPDELVIMDSPDISTAKNVIRLNKNGIGFSQTGYNGVYKNAWTIDGNLVADFITTGTMLANRVRGGTFEVGGKGLGADGQILVYDANGTTIGVINKNGITISNGVFSGTVTANKGKIGGFTISDSKLSGDEDCEIEWGDFYIDGNGAYIGGWIVNEQDGLVGPVISGNGQAQVWDADGNIYCTELYVQQGWWKNWSLTETVETLWNYVYNGGWCRNDSGCGGNCDGDCSDTCPDASCTYQSGCIGGDENCGCEIACGSQGGCTCVGGYCGDCSDCSDCTCDGHGSGCGCEGEACGPGDGL